MRPLNATERFIIIYTVAFGIVALIGGSFNPANWNVYGKEIMILWVLKVICDKIKYPNS